jgi:hypothetical protein
VLEFDAATKRFGALAALDGCTFVAPARQPSVTFAMKFGKEWWR